MVPIYSDKTNIFKYNFIVWRRKEAVFLLRPIATVIQVFKKKLKRFQNFFLFRQIPAIASCFIRKGSDKYNQLNINS